MILTPDDILEIEIELTGTCNLSCPLCTRNYKHSNHLNKKNIRSLSEIINQFDKFKNLKTVNIAGAVSEPTLYPELIEFLEYLKNRNIENVKLYSNASILNLSYWEKIGTIFTNENWQIIFTICGSTQELHSTYRVGSNLQYILDNAEAFRKTNKSKSDYLQYIIFEYNKKDIETKELKKIFSKFNNTFFVGSEGERLLNEYNKNFNTVKISPEKLRNKRINNIFNFGKEKILKNKNNYKIDCISLKQKRIFIDQFGNEIFCFNHAEFYPNSFCENNIYDFTKVCNFEYDDCFKCEKKVQYLIEKLGLYFLC